MYSWRTRPCCVKCEISRCRRRSARPSPISSATLSQTRPTPRSTHLCLPGRHVNNSHDNVYRAVIMTKVIARVHPVHLMNVAANPQTKPIDLDCESAENWQLSSTSTIAIVIITQPVGCRYSFYRPTKCGRLSRPKHCSKGAQPVLKTVYHSSCRDKHNCQRRD